jgi:Na+-driven multidrug efflux pump
MVGMAIGAGDFARARRLAWTAAGIATLALGGIGLAVGTVPSLWSSLFTADPGVRAAANLYLRLAGPAFAFVGMGMALYFASQGSGRVLGPVLAATVRLAVVAGGGWILAAADAPVWTLFALVALSMLAYGLTTAAAVYVTSWGSHPAR